MFQKNRVVAGDYIGKSVYPPSLFVSKHPTIGNIELSNKTVASYELIDNTHRKSALSGVFRALVGKSIFGNAGMLAGAMTAKNKNVYTVAINFLSGERSLLEIDDEIYKAIIRSCF